MLYNFRLASPEARRLIVGKRTDKNPLTETRKKRIVPFHKMLVGDSLFFTRAEMLKKDIDRVISCVHQLHHWHNMDGENMFAILRTKEKVEIVRIR